MSWSALALILTAIIAAAWLAVRQARASGPGRWLWWLLPLACVLAAIGLAASDFITRKMVGQLAMPTGLIWLGLIAAAAHRSAARRPAQAGSALVLLALYSLAGSNPLGSRALAQLESGIPLNDVSDATPFDAVFVLGGGSVRRPDGVPELGASGDRVMMAAQLYLSGQAKMLIASGDFGADEVWLWKRLGIPGSATLVLAEPRNTSEEIAACRAVLAEHGWKRAGLVSSAWHLPRALRLCARNGIHLEPVPCDWLGVRPEWTALELVPQPLGFSKVQTAAWEHLGRWCGQ